MKHLSFFFSSNVFVACAFLLIGLAVYAPSFGNRFLLDDESQVLQNALIHSPANISVFFLGSTMHQESTNSLGGIYYKPVMSLSYSVLWWLSPGDPVPFHLFQLLLVVANALLVWSLLRRYMAEVAALLVAMLFLVHPLNTEVVVYVADLQDALYTFFGLLALNLLAAAETLQWKKILGLSALLLLSFLSKESGVLYLVTCLVYAGVFKRRLFSRAFAAGLFCLAVYFYLRVGVAHLTVLTYKQNQIGRAPLDVRLLTAPLALFSYLWKFIFPRDITATQDWVILQMDLWRFWLPLAACLAVLAVSIWHAWRRLRAGDVTFAFFTFWAFMGMGFHSHILISLDGTVADRWFYFTSIGFCAMLGLLIDRYFLPWRPRATAAVLVALMLALGVRSAVRSHDWYDNYTLCLHDLKIFPGSYDMHNNLGVELFRRGDVPAAKKEFERSVELAPGWDINWNNLGAAYNRLGDVQKAEESYLKSMEHGTYYMAYENYASILVAQGRIEEAKKFITERALPLFPASQSLNLIYTSIRGK